MSNFFLRVLSSIILLPLFIYSIYEKNFFYYFSLTLILIISTYEIKFLYKFNKKIFIIVLFLIVLFIFSIIELRGSSLKNFYFLIWAMTIVWMSDIGGYFAGKFFKGRTFSVWSPNKTISGLVGSIVISQISFLIIFFSLNIKFSIFYFFIQLIICISAILGDLYFSYIKRKTKIKDYSNLIPGHGGLLDRIDGLIFGLIIFYFINFIYDF